MSSLEPIQKMFSYEQWLSLLQKRIQIILNHDIPLFDHYINCDSTFKCIQKRGANIIKIQAIRLYIDTMINIYNKSEDIKSEIFICFGCSFYKSSKNYFLQYKQPQKQKEYCGIEIKKGIIISLIGNTSLFLLSFCLNQIIYY